MIDKILELSLRQRAFILLAALALVAVGLWAATRLPIDAVPDITGVQVQINTEVPALAAEESEKLVTRPIEIEMAGLPGIEEMRSLTKFGLSQVTLQFSDNTDVYRARQLVTERLQAAVEHLPHDVAPKLAPISTGLGEIFYYNVSYKPGAKRPELFRDQVFQLRELHDYTIKPLLRAVSGVAEVNESGGYERQFVIQPRPEDLERSGMTFSELADVIAANVENAGGGIISRGGNQLSIRAVTRANNLQDIANLPVKFAAGVKPLLVKDLADVTYGSRIRTGAATIDGEETVIGAAMMLAGENSREVAERVKARLAEIQEKLPDNVQVQPQYDRSILINKTIHTVSTNLFEGAILVTALLFALLGNWRAALIVTIVYIPILALTGIEGKMFHPMAVTVMLALTGALILALTLMPVLCSLLLRGRVGEGDNFIIRAAKATYEPMLRIALASRWLVVLAAIAIFAGSIWLFNRLGAEFVPKLDEGSITSMLYKPVGMSLDESVRTDLELEMTLLLEFPEITRILTRIGTSDIASDPMSPNECDVYTL